MVKENKINSGDQFTEYITSDMAGVSYDTSFNMCKINYHTMI